MNLVAVFLFFFIVFAHFTTASNIGGEAVHNDSESTRRIQDDRPTKRRTLNRAADVKHLSASYSEWKDTRSTFSSGLEFKPTSFDDIYFEREYQMLQSKLGCFLNPIEAKLYFQLASSIDAEQDCSWAQEFKDYTGPLSACIFMELLKMAMNHNHPEPVRALMQVNMRYILPVASHIQRMCHDAKNAGRFDHAVALALPFKTNPMFRETMMHLVVNLMNTEKYDEVQLLLQDNADLKRMCTDYFLHPPERDAHIFMNYWQETRYRKCLSVLDIPSERFQEVLQTLKQCLMERRYEFWISIQVMHHFAEKSVNDEAAMADLLIEASTFLSAAIPAMIEPFWTEQHRNYVAQNLDSILAKLLDSDPNTERLYEVIFNFVSIATMKDVETTRVWIDRAIKMAEEKQDNVTERELTNRLSQLTF